ncbi:MAG TPA: hypothetical protein VJT74_15540 [Pyrinomonadaceae bacterium]|nr:hypothetical protein [Pyrinomonadaceae bacterium]
MFGKKAITCRAGEWTTVIRSRFAQMPAVWEVNLQALNGGEVAGEFEETKSRWIFRGRPTGGRLRERLTFERGYWNTFYTVRIRPRSLVRAEIR